MSDRRPRVTVPKDAFLSAIGINDNTLRKAPTGGAVLSEREDLPTIIALDGSWIVAMGKINDEKEGFTLVFLYSHGLNSVTILDFSDVIDLKERLAAYAKTYPDSGVSAGPL